MDAPATTSADNGTSGGGDGWFKPRKPAAAPGAEQQGAHQRGAEQRGTEPQSTEGGGRRLAGLRPVGRGTTAPGTPPGAAPGTTAPMDAAPRDAGRDDAGHHSTGHHTMGRHDGAWLGTDGPGSARPDTDARIAAQSAQAPSQPAAVVLPKLIPAPATAVPPLVSPVPSRPATDTFAAPEALQVPAQRTAPAAPPPAATAPLSAPPETPPPAPNPEPTPFRPFTEEAPQPHPEPGPESSRPVAQETPHAPEPGLEHLRSFDQETPHPDPESAPEPFRPYAQETLSAGPESESGPELLRPFARDVLRPEGDSGSEPFRAFPSEAPAESEPLRASASDTLQAAAGSEADGSFVPDAFRPAAGFPRPSAPNPVTTDTLPAEPEPPQAPAEDLGQTAPEPFRAFGSDSLPAPEAPPEGSPDAVLVRRTMAAIGSVADKVTSYFYALLFVRHPDLRPLFPPAMDAQRDRLLKALLTAAEHIDDTPVLVGYLQNLGRGHRKYGTRPEHYPAVGECLIEALAKYAESVWEPETEAAWVRTYTTISQVMIDAAAVDELRAPAWWQAEIVSHELRTQDIAVLTVRPDQPYPFLAGQYASLETPWWPRIWRHYSFASAPRSDGLLSFHVKAVPAGWVSGALVHRAQPGDVIRLGPPAGSMTVDHTRDSGLLCLGGGTGIAPIKALVEDVAEHGTRRRMEVFYGARTDHDLYDIDTMLRLQQSHSWLEVRPVVDKHGLLQLPDAIRTFGPWDEYDAYLSGPVGMIRSGVDALRGAGIPKERIRHDSVAELVAAG